MVAIDGDIIASENFSNILLDLAVLRSLNIKVVLVHGASLQINNSPRSAASRFRIRTARALPTRRP